MTKTKIDWADRVWNPVTGCTKIAIGCKNCYAARHAQRFWKDRAFGDLIFHHDRLGQPPLWKKPAIIFVDSMGDIFHKDVPFEFIDKIFDVMALCPQHIFIVLTKRAERMMLYFRLRGNPKPLPNVRLGVSVSNQNDIDMLVPHLLNTPAAFRLISYEPALGPADFNEYLWQVGRRNSPDMIIVGGESGPHFRPMDPQWARDVRDQCDATSTYFYMKQMAGSHPKRIPIPEDLNIREVPV